MLTQILSEMTVSFGERILLKALESEDQTVLRNVLIKHFTEKQHWKTKHLKKAIMKFFEEQNVEGVSEKDI